MRDETALTKLYLRWARARDPLAGTRRLLVSTQIDSSRRREWGGERATDERPEQPDDDPRLIASDDRDELRRLLGELSSQDRTVRSAAARSVTRRRVEVLR